MNPNITQQTFESNEIEIAKETIESNKLDFLMKKHDNYDFDKKSRFSNKNNIFKEIEVLKQKEGNTKFDYIEILKITEDEYVKSQSDYHKAINDLKDEVINEIRSTKKLLNVHKNVLEMLSYLIGEKCFEWNTFKEKINIHEIKYKMTNVLNIFNNYDKKIINSFLNKISKNKKLNHEFLFETFFGLSIIFNWVKAVLKIYLYRHQNRATIHLKENIDLDQRSDDFDKQNLPIDSNAFNKSDLFNSQEAVRYVRNKTNVVEKTVSKITAISLSIKTNENKRSTFETTIDYPLYITSTLARNNNLLSQSRFKRNATNTVSEQFIKTSKIEKINTKVIDKHIKLEIDVNESKKQIMYNKMMNLPLIHVRTFRQLREHFKMNSKVTNQIHKIPDEIDKFSLRNEANLDKMITVLAKGNISNLNRLTVLEFCKNLEKTNKGLSLVNEKEKKKLLKSINKYNIK